MSDQGSLERTDPTTQRAAGLAGGLGPLILVSGVFFTGTGLVVVSNVIAGAIIAAAGGYAASVPHGGRLPGVLAPIVVLLAGIWVVASPFVFGVTGVLFWSSILLGGLVVVLSLVSAYGSVRLSGGTAARA